MALTIDPHVDDPAPTVWQVCAAQPHGSAEDPAWTRLVFLDSGTVERDELEGTHTQRHVRPIRASMLPACVRIVCGAQDDSKVLRRDPRICPISEKAASKFWRISLRARSRQPKGDASPPCRAIPRARVG